MTPKIYVGNMSFETNEDELRALFTEYGEVTSVNIVTDRFTGRPRGFGFVEMATEEQAASAIAALNNTEVKGRLLRVNKAQDKPRRDNR